MLSTLRTNDAPSALTRLLELDVAAYLVASTVQAVPAQRLVRVICTSCKTRVPAVAADLAELSGGAVVDRHESLRHSGERADALFMELVDRPSRSRLSARLMRCVVVCDGSSRSAMASLIVARRSASAGVSETT